MSSMRISHHMKAPRAAVYRALLDRRPRASAIRRLSSLQSSTDATAPALLGMSARQFRDAVARQRLPFMEARASQVPLSRPLSCEAGENEARNKVLRAVFHGDC